MSCYRAIAPAKINLGLLLGPRRQSDGRHEIATVMQSISLADQLTLEPAAAGAGADEISCPALAGPPEQNLAAAALAAFRAATGWAAPAVRLTIHKRIPIAAGLAGGSADAAATLRLASRASGLGDESLLRELGASLGADVPAQISPGRWLAWGAGERLLRLADPTPALGVLLLPFDVGLSTSAVYQEADRLGLGRSSRGLAAGRRRLERALSGGAPLPSAGELLDNELQAASESLCPAITPALAEARRAGAAAALVSGSGPTVVGLFAGADGGRQAERAASALAGRVPRAISASSLAAGVAEAVGATQAA